MSNILRIDPDLSFPYDKPFEVTDRFNGPLRGTWWFRSSINDEMQGPYPNWRVAKVCQEYQNQLLENN